MATHDLKAFWYLFWTAQKGRVLLALLCSALLCSAVSVLHRKSVCQVLFHGVHLLLPNKAQKRLTASSLMLATGCHCSFRRFRPFWLCVPVFRRVCLFLRHCAWILNYCTIICIGVQRDSYTIRAIKMILYAAIWWISPFLFVRFVSTCANSVQIAILNWSILQSLKLYIVRFS